MPIPQGPAETEPLEVEDFSGGFTDFYIAGPLNRGQLFDNFDIIRYDQVGKAISRFGSQVFNLTYPAPPTGGVRIGRLKTFQGFVIPFSANVAYTLGGGGWGLLQGPTGNSIFPSGTTSASNVISLAQDDNHLIATADSYTQPIKMYVDGGGVLQARTAGLPRLASNPTITPGANTGKSFLYRFIYTYQYVANGVTIKTLGGFVQVVCASADAPNLNANAISAIPVLTNSASQNYDTSNLKVEIYRTINGGSAQFYLVGSVTNGTTTFSDNVSDTALQLNQQFYMNGGVVENEPLPPAKCVHTIPNGITYYGNVQVGGQNLTNRVIQTVPGTVDGYSSVFFVDLPDSVVGVSSVRGLPIALCAGSVFRLDGAFNLLGQGGILATRISDTAGCVSSQSIVQTIEGVFWAGPTGFYYTDGYQVIKINHHWVNTYGKLVQNQTQQNRIQGVYNQQFRRIHWTTQSSTGNTADCDVIYTVHLDFGIKEEMAFTSYSGTTFQPSSIEMNGNILLRGHALGYILQHVPNVYSDPVINSLVAANLWDIAPIIYNYKSCAHNFGSNFLRKFTPRISLTAQNTTNMSIQINSITDDGRIIQSLVPIRYRGNALWNDPNAVWGNSSDIWNADGTVDSWRRFPRNSLRCTYKQIQITNANVAILSSDQIGPITVDASAKTSTLTNAGETWPTNFLNYNISFSPDGYIKQYPITLLNSSTVLTFSDAQNTCPSGPNNLWIVRGIPKGEAIGLLSYTIHWAPLGRTQRPYTFAESGEVGSGAR